MNDKMSASRVSMGLEQPPDGRAGAGHGQQYAQVPACSVDAEDDAGRGAVRGVLFQDDQDGSGFVSVNETFDSAHELGTSGDVRSLVHRDDEHSVLE
ncbi:hypothetical protein ACP4I1_31730 [Streptomyces sp. WG4]|uniref:hypothetical protein n=1 Tax=Streptomyces sp. WG4 TaxID=3417649 RepID=UPI0015CBF87C|nr:hypothetical protein [Streptomyces sp. alain-838]